MWGSTKRSCFFTTRNLKNAFSLKLRSFLIKYLLQKDGEQNSQSCWGRNLASISGHRVGRHSARVQNISLIVFIFYSHVRELVMVPIV